MLNACVLTIASLVLHPHGTPQPSVDALKAQREAFVTAFNARDVARVTELYAADATFLPFTGQIVKSGAAIAPAMTRVAAQVTIDLQPVSSAASGNLAYESGTWTHVDRASAAIVDSGTYLWVWRQDERGGWAIASHAVTRKAAPTR